MSKLDRLAEDLIARGQYSTRQEVEDAAADLLAHELDLQQEADRLGASILQGYRDLAAGRFIESTGDWRKDLELYRQRKAGDRQ